MADEPLCILVIDDNADDRALAIRALRKEFPDASSVELIEVNDAASLDACFRPGCTLVAITDYSLRWTDGITVLRRCLAHATDMPVIMFTNTGTEEVCAEAMKSGLFDYIIKRPQHYYRLPLAVKAAVERTRTRRQLAEVLGREQQLRAEAERANRRKDEFLAALSHELRTPLTPILGISAMLEANASLPPDVRADIATIRRNAELEARLVDDLLDVSRITQGKLQLHFEVVDAHELIRSAWETCRAGIGGGGGGGTGAAGPDAGGRRAGDVEVTVALRAAEHRVWADRGRIQQIFWNLFANAVKFTPPGGRIEIRSDNPEPGVLRVEVQDTGIGIEPDAIERMFTAFEQGPPVMRDARGGLGLGLAIARTLSELHRGSLVARSEGPQMGATFSLTFPTSAADAQRAAPTPGPTPAEAAAATRPQERPQGPAGIPAERKPEPEGRTRILLVEDHPDTLAALTRLLKAMGYGVITATNVADALATAVSTDFDLLVTDIGLPDATGHDLMREILKVKPVKGIAVSGYGMDYDIQRSREAGFVEHLVKPVNVDKLRTVIERVASQGS